MLLALDTSGPLVTVAVHDGERLLADEVAEQPRQHGEQLAGLVAAALGSAGTDRHGLTRIAVGVGPGPYTGLRVGLVTAQTLGHVLDVEVVGVCSMDVLAVAAVELGTVGEEGFVVATDARRREVYLAEYAAGGGRVSGPVVDRPAVLGTARPAVGAGAALYGDSFPDARSPENPTSGWLARAVIERRAPLLEPHPLYLRRPDAVARADQKAVT